MLLLQEHTPWWVLQGEPTQKWTLINNSPIGIPQGEEDIALLNIFLSIERDGHIQWRNALPHLASRKGSKRLMSSDNTRQLKVKKVYYVFFMLTLLDTQLLTYVMIKVETMEAPQNRRFYGQMGVPPPLAHP